MLGESILNLDNDLQFSRQHFYKSVKFGVVTLDENVFSIYTNSLLHAKNVLHKYKNTNIDDQTKSGEINIHSLSSLMAATSLTKTQIDEYVSGLSNKLFNVKNAEELKKGTAKRSESVQI